MKALVVYLVLQISTLVPISAKIPDGYKLKLEPDCGADGIEDATITITTDMVFISASAECSNGDHLFENTDGIHFDLEASFPPSEEDNCVFYKRTGLVYYINVAINYGHPGDELQQFEDMYTVVCSFSLGYGDESFEHEVIDGVFAPKEVRKEQTVYPPVTINLFVTDVLGRNITGTTIDMGRSIQLKLEGTNVPESAGIFPASCDAISGAKRYAILRAGCGDGVIFKKDQGFTTTGLVSRSPFFKAFAVGRSPSLKFECRVSFCSVGCEGHTCENQRFRRSADGEKYVLASTATRRLVHVPLILDVDGSGMSMEDDQNGPPDSMTDIGPYHVFGQITKSNSSNVLDSEPPDDESHRQEESPVSTDNVLQYNSSDSDSLDQQDQSAAMGASQEDLRSAQHGNVSSSAETEHSPVESTDASQLTNVSANGVANENTTNTSSSKSRVSYRTGLRTIQTGVVSVLDNPNVPNPVDVGKSPNVTVPQTDHTYVNVSSGGNAHVVQSGLVFVKGKITNNILESKSSVESIPSETNTDTVTGGTIENTDTSEEHVLSGTQPVYVIGIIIAALVSLASFILAISLCRRRRQQALALSR